MEKKQKNSKVNFWLLVGVIVLIVLLVIWLTMADLWGDTDVAARAIINTSRNFNILS